MDEQLIAAGLKGLFERRGQFIVLGLTGRIGSGCTTAADLLTKTFSDLRLEPIASPLVSVEQRKHRVVVEFAEKNWVPFLEVSVTLTIVTFVLEADANELETFLKAHVRDKDLSTLMGEIKRTANEWTKVRGVVVPGPKKIHSEAAAYRVNCAQRRRTNLVSARFSTLIRTPGSRFRTFLGLVLLISDHSYSCFQERWDKRFIACTIHCFRTRTRRKFSCRCRRSNAVWYAA